MSSTSESETSILLGNKHLLAIFFVLAILLGIAFTGGYMVGHNSKEKTVAVTASLGDAAKTPPGGETLSVTPEGERAAEAPAPPPAVQTATVEEPAPQAAAPVPVHVVEPVVTKPKPKPAPVVEEEEKPAKPPKTNFAGPQSGQKFLQVTAVRKAEAQTVASVLNKKGYRAHAVPKPGSSDVYRVLVGPLKDEGDLSSTRESLRKAGFTNLFVQRY